MEALVQALGGLLLRAVATIILLILLHFYLKFMLFSPLQEVLWKRREATEGTLEAARKTLDVAAQKASMYELALKEARDERYREQEETRKQWLEDQSRRIEEARQKARQMVKEASQNIDAEVAESRKDLASRSQMLALQIVETLASGRAR